MIKQAGEQDIPGIEAILADAVQWMSKSGLQNRWNASNIKWASLSESFKISDFHIACQDGLPAACMALTDYDPVCWPGIPKGESLYLHKLAVKREFAGKGFAKELMDHAKHLALQKGISAIRLNCNQHRLKLRELYEKEGFRCVGEKPVFESYGTALYVCYL